MAKTDDKCCQNQDLIHDNWMNICRQCGQVINHDFATIVIKVIENKKISVPKKISSEQGFE